MDYLHSIVGWLWAGPYWLVTAAVTLRNIAPRSQRSATPGWVLKMHIVPIVGWILYLLFGELNLGRKRAARANTMIEPYLTNLTTQFHDNKDALPGGELTEAINSLMTTQVGIGALNYGAMHILRTPEDIFERLIR